MLLGNVLTLLVVNVVLANSTVNHAVTQLKGNQMFVHFHVIQDMGPLAAKINALQTGKQLRSGAAALIADARQSLQPKTNVCVFTEREKECKSRTPTQKSAFSFVNEPASQPARPDNDFFMPAFQCCRAIDFSAPAPSTHLLLSGLLGNAGAKEGMHHTERVAAVFLDISTKVRTRRTTCRIGCH